MVKNSTRIIVGISFFIGVVWVGAYAKVRDGDNNLTLNLISVADEVKPIDNLKDPALQTIIVGLRSREAKVASVKGYFLNELYGNLGDQTIAQFLAASADNSRQDTITLPSANVLARRIYAVNEARTQEWNGLGEPLYTKTTDVSKVEFNVINLYLQVAAGPNGSKSSYSASISRYKLRLLGSAVLSGIDTYKIGWNSSFDGGNEEGVAWIAPKLGYLTLRKEVVVKRKATVLKQIDIVDKAALLTEDVWVPITSRLNVYKLIGDEHTWLRTQKVVALEVEANTQLPHELFTIDVPPGTQTADLDVPSPEIFTLDKDGDIALFNAKLKKAIEKGEQPDIQAIDAEELRRLGLMGKLSSEIKGQKPLGGKIELLNNLPSLRTTTLRKSKD